MDPLNMNNSPSFCRSSVVLTSVVLIAFLAGAGDLRSEPAKPPKGFSALFNGEDLMGWHGMDHFDPRKLATMTEEERSKKLAKDTADAKAHWSVENGELVND